MQVALVQLHLAPEPQNPTVKLIINCSKKEVPAKR